MLKTSAKRKLLSEDILDEVHLRKSYGAGVNRIILDLQLDISRPALLKLLKYYAALLAQEYSETAKYKVINSLFPAWLDPQGDKSQTNPDGWSYEGKFPYGKWVRE